jgi:hypothetical protein
MRVCLATAFSIAREFSSRAPGLAHGELAPFRPRRNGSGAAGSRRVEWIGARNRRTAMSRLEKLKMSDATWFTRFADWLLRKQGGDQFDTAATIIGYNPPVLFSFLAFGAGYLRWRSLPARLKRLVHLRAAMRVGCPS